MTAQTWPIWLESEARVRSRTTSEHEEELAVIGSLLDVFWAGFSSISASAGAREGNQLDLAWTPLAVRSFDSLACAYELLQRGYYSQTMALARSVDEDWLTCKDCVKSPRTLAALLSDGEDQQRRRPTYADMALRLEAPYNKEWWDEIYGWNSRFAHARYLGLTQLLDPTMNTARVGPYYDSDAFLVSCYFLVGSAVRMAGVLKQLLERVASPVDRRWLEKFVASLQEADAWLRSVEHRLWSIPGG
jgi:hypothetical protein